MLSALWAVFVTLQGVVEAAPPRAVAPPRATAQQLLQQLRIRPETLRAPTLTSPQGPPDAPVAGSLAPASVELAPRHREPRKTLGELITELERRPEVKRQLDSLRRVGAIGRNPAPPPELREESPGPRGEIDGAIETIADPLQASPPMAVISPAAPVTGMSSDFIPTGPGPGLALFRVFPAVHRFDTRDHWAVKVEPVCNWSPDPATALGRSYPRAYTTAMARMTSFEGPRSTNIVATGGLGSGVSGRPNLGLQPWPCNSQLGSNILANASGVTIQPEIIVAATNLQPGNYVLSMRAWGRHQVAVPLPTTVFLAYQPPIKVGEGEVANNGLVQAPVHGWYDYAGLLSVVQGGPDHVYFWTFKVLGPLGATLYISEIALYKIG